MIGWVAGGSATNAPVKRSAPDRAARSPQTDFTEDLKAIDLPVLVMPGTDDQIVPFANHAPKAVELLRNGTLKAHEGLGTAGPAVRRVVQRPSQLLARQGL